MQVTHALPPGKHRVTRVVLPLAIAAAFVAISLVPMPAARTLPPQPAAVPGPVELQQPADGAVSRCSPELAAILTARLDLGTP